MKSPGDNVAGKLRFDTAFSDGRGESGWLFDVLGNLLRVGRGNMQGRRALGALASVSVQVRSAGDRYGVELRLAEEVTEADSVDATDALEGLERGHHSIRLELGEERCGEVDLGGETREGEILRAAKNAEFQADGVDGQGIRRRQGHAVMLAGS